MGPLDSAAKAILREVPQDLASLAPVLAGKKIRNARADDTVLPAFSLTTDKILLLEVEGEDEDLSLHVEVEANWSAKVPRRAFRYWSLAHRANDNLWSLVICLEPGNKQGEPKDYYERTVGGRRAVRFEFDVVKVWELKADDLLRDAKPGLLPLVPYAGGTSKVHVEKAMDSLARIEPEDRRGELQAALVAFAGNVFPDVAWGARMPEELLMGSTIYQRGEVSGQRKTLTRWIRKRFPGEADSLVARLELADEPGLDHVADLLAERLSDDELLGKLEQILPKPEGSADDDQTE
jgi:hypothetical protein